MIQVIFLNCCIWLIRDCLFMFSDFLVRLVRKRDFGFFFARSALLFSFGRIIPRNDS